MTLAVVPDRIRYCPALVALYRKVHFYDQNALVFTLGGTGTRKSGSSISWAFDLDPDFNINRIVFLATDFMNLIERGEPITKPNGEIEYRKLKNGSVIIWDEMGVEADNTEWNTAKSKLIKWTFTMFRYMNLIVLMTATHFFSVQIGVRRLTHAALDMDGIPEDTTFFPLSRYAQGNFYWLYSDSFTGKPYRKELVYKNADGVLCTSNPQFIERPPMDFENEYKKKKDFYVQNWFSLYRKQMEYINKRIGGEVDENQKEPFNALEEKVVNTWWEYWSSSRKRFSADLIELKLKMKKNRARLLSVKLNDMLVNNKITLGPHLVEQSNAVL